MKEFILLLQKGQLFLIPLSVLIITQTTKVLLELKQHQKLKIAHLGHYGGMPSAHTALFVSLSTIMLINFGWFSPYFAIAIIICVIMVRDALGIRHHLGNHGLILKSLIKDLYQRKHTTIKHDEIVTRLGHTPWQVTVGALYGFLLTIIFYFFLANLGQ